MAEGVAEAEAMVRVPLEAEDEEIVGGGGVPLEEGGMVAGGVGDVATMLEVSEDSVPVAGLIFASAFLSHK